MAVTGGSDMGWVPRATASRQLDSLSMSTSLVLTSRSRGLRSGRELADTTDWMIAAEVRNSGTSIRDMIIGAGDGLAYSWEGSRQDRGFPLDLQPHASQVLYFESKGIRELLVFCDTMLKKPPRSMSATVTLGSGARLTTPRVPLRCFRTGPAISP